MTVGPYETIRVEGPSGAGDATPGILTVTIDHPSSAMNAVDEALHADLARLFADLKRVDGVRAIVLTGSGRAFSAGGDMSWFPELRNPARLHALRREAKQIVWDLLDVEPPVVCGLNGAAAGLGASIALLCDVIVRSATSGRAERSRPASRSSPSPAKKSASKSGTTEDRS